MKGELESRFRYHAPRPEQVTKYTQIRGEARELAVLLEALCPESREKSLALTNLDQVVMWANAAIARNT